MATRVIVTPALSPEFSVSVNVVAAADHPIYQHPCFQKLAVCTTTEHISVRPSTHTQKKTRVDWTGALGKVNAPVRLAEHC